MRELARSWWVVALRGLVNLLFGLSALLVPGLALTTLALLFGAYALLDGVSAIASGLGGRDGGRRLPLVLLGVLGVLAGIVTFVNPLITALTLLTLIAVWAIVTGVLEVVAAVRLRDVIPGVGEWMLGLSGLLSAAFGVAALAFSRIVRRLVGRVPPYALAAIGGGFLIVAWAAPSVAVNPATVLVAGAGLGVEWLRDHPRQLQAVTVDDALAAGARYLAPNRLTTVLVGDVAQVEVPLRTLVDLEVA